MPDQLDDDAWTALVQEPDTFKLAIRGFAAIEADLNAFIVESFPSEIPEGGVRGLGGFEKRLLLASALGIVPKPFLSVIRAPAKIRHEFAHGVIEALSDRTAAAVRRTLIEFLDDERFTAGMRLASSHDTVRVSLMVARSVVRAGGEARRKEREADVRRREAEQRGSALSAAFIKQLLDKPETESESNDGH